MNDKELIARLEALRRLVILETGCLAQAIKDRDNKPGQVKEKICESGAINKAWRPMP